jgi:hypothetical protein
MNLNEIKNIDQVIEVLEDIILETKINSSPLGYFAVLYQKVTRKVKDGIASDFFDDGSRMEILDVVFAKRYIKAYYAFQKNEEVTTSWLKTFELSTKHWPIVLQHLLMGMNAHINLDLGIAAAHVSRGQNIDDLKNDFNKINEVLAGLVNEVQNDLTEIWPTLKVILKFAGKVDDFLVDFNMKTARDGAWKFAKSIADLQGDELESQIVIRDQKVAVKSRLITNPGIIAKIIQVVIRIGERGNVAERIEKMK